MTMSLKEISNIISDEETILMKEEIREYREKSHERLQSIAEKF